MGTNEDSGMGEQPEQFDEFTGPYPNAPANSHVHPVMRGVLADALKAAAPAYGRGAHHNASRKIVADIGTLPPHGSPHDAGAKGTDAPSAFDAAAWIERAAPGTLLVAGMISEVVPGLLVQIAEAAYSQGCLDESARFNARLDAIMGARTALAPCPKEPAVTKPTYIPCERCGDECFYEPPHPAEPDVGVGAWRGGFVCECGWEKENEPVTADRREQ